MFKKTSSQESYPKDVDTYIGPSVKIDGHFKSEGDVKIDGEIKGSLKTKKNIIIGPGAKINGNVNGHKIKIAGQVHGNIQALEYLEVNQNARIVGDIVTKNICVTSGAVLSGQIKMDEGVLPVEKIPEKKLDEKNNKKGNKLKK